MPSLRERLRAAFIAFKEPARIQESEAWQTCMNDWYECGLAVGEYRVERARDRADALRLAFQIGRITPQHRVHRLNAAVYDHWDLS